MNKLPPVAVVFAVLNHAATLRALFDALDATDWPHLRIVAVDCGSQDGGLEMLERRAARRGKSPFTLLRAPGAGRATALDLGFAAAGGCDVVRLHADVVPEASDWLMQLHTVLTAHPDCGIVGAKIVHASDRIQSCGRNLINGLGIAPEWSDYRWMEADRDEPSRPTEVDGVSGELCLIRRDVLVATGGLDTNFDPVFGDDDDLCLMARWHGFRVMVEPAVRGVHYASRRTHMTRDVAPEPTGQLQVCDEDRRALLGAHREYWRTKWGFDPDAPDLHEIRRRYGHTRICWRIGERLLETLPEHPAVDVCFVTWNSMAVLPRMLDQLAATRWHDVRVFVTDNGSTDGTASHLEQRATSFPFPLHVERLPTNVGCGQALNCAILRGEAPLVARIDDDTFVPPDWLAGLAVNFRLRPYAGVVGPRVLYENDGAALQSGPSRAWPQPFPGTGPGDAERVAGRSRVNGICGCCNLYRRSVFSVVGLLDVRYSPSQFDETDHHVALLAAGYEAIYDGSVTVRHMLNAGRMETMPAVGNFLGNKTKIQTKWGSRFHQILDRAIDLSIDGRFLPTHGSSEPLRAMLAPVPQGPPARPHRAPEEIARWSGLAHRRSVLRSLGGPLQAWWQHQIALCEDGLAAGEPFAALLATQLADLLPHAPPALLALARSRAAEGRLQVARQLARRAARLDPDDAALARQALAIGQEPQERMVFPSVPAAPRAANAPRVLLVPPVARHDEAMSLVAGTREALHAVAIASRTETDLVPRLRGEVAVHAFGLGECSTLVGRLQVLRAESPGCRIALSPMLPDPGPVNWAQQVIGAHYFAPEAELVRLFASAAHSRLTVNGSTARHLAGEAFPAAVDYERRCLDFVDAVVVPSAAELRWLRQRHPHLPTAEPIAEGVPGAVAWKEAKQDETVPVGGALAIGPRDLHGNHLAMVLALKGTGLPLSLCGGFAPPQGDWHLRARGDARLRLLPALHGAALACGLRRSSVLLWLPMSPCSFALPLQAAVAGAELVLARGVGAESLFGDHATYVDPFDLDELRAAALAALRRWQCDPDQPWRVALRERHSRVAHGELLRRLYGMAPAELECEPAFV